MTLITNEDPLVHDRNSVLEWLTLMKSRKLTLALTCLNLALVGVVLFRPAWDRPVAAESPQTPQVLRAQGFDLVDARGQVRAQLYLAEDGGGSLRLHSPDGTVRVKLGGSADGSSLLLFDKEVQPAVELSAKKTGTSIRLAEKGKEARVLKP